MKKFPKTIYVTRDQEGTTDEYLSLHDSVEDVLFDDTTKVARYELLEVGEVQVNRTYWSKGVPKDFGGVR